MLCDRAMMMNFPDWFHLAFVLLLCDKSFQNGFHSDCSIGSAETDKANHIQSNCSSAAARYIAWIINPIGGPHQDLLVNYLANLSESWTLKCKRNKGTSNNTKDIMNSNLRDEENINSCGYSCHTLHLWLKEFQDKCIRYCRHVVNNSESYGRETTQAIINRQDMLLRRIPLGILIGYLSYIDEEGCEMLLHYAATGSIFQLEETQDGKLKHRKKNRKCQQASIGCVKKYNTKEAIAGICIVFYLTDLAESLSASLFESEEIGLTFLSQVKLKTVRYLLECIKRLLHLKIDGDKGFLMSRDLCKRIIQWRHQGQDDFHDFRDLNNVIDALRLA